MAGTYGGFTYAGLWSGAQYFEDTLSLSGSGTLSFPSRTPAAAGAGNLSGSGTLSFPTRTPAFAVALPLSGSGALSFSAAPHVPTALGLTGGGNLTLAGAAAFARALALSGSGSLANTVAGLHITQALPLSGSGTLTAAGNPAFAVTLALSGSGTQTRSAAPAVSGSTALAGEGTQTRSAAPGFTDTRALTGSGTLTFPAHVPGITIGLPLSGTGTLTFPARIPAFAVALPLSGSGALTFTASPAFARTLPLSGSGSLTLTAAPAFTGALALSGTGTQTRSAAPSFAGTRALTGSGTLTAAGTPAYAVTRALTGSGTLTFTASPAFAVALALSGTGTLTFPVRTPATGAAYNLTGLGTLSFAGTPAFIAAPLLSGEGTLSLVSSAEFTETLALSGSGSLGLFGIIVAFVEIQLASEGTLGLSAIGYHSPTGPHPPVPGSAAIVPVTALRWRYVMADLRTDATIDEFELTDVRFDQRINQPGAFSASYVMATPAAAAKGRQIAEGRTVCYVYRGLEVFAGPYLIWTVQAAGDPRGATKLSITGAGLESYFNRREIRTTLDFQQVDQLAIARALITTPQADPGGDVLVEVDDAVSGVLRDRREWTATSGSIYGQRLSELAAVENGFEFRIVSYIDPSLGQRVRRFITGYPRLGRPDNDHVFTYPGTITGWSNSRDSTAGATSFRSRGDTPTSEEITEDLVPVMSDVVDREDLLNTGWPRLDRTDDYSSVITKSVLDEHTRENAATYGGSADVLSVSVRLAPDGVGDFTPNDLGSSARLVIQDDYLGLINEVWRVVGMDVRPASRDQAVDMADLIFEVVGA